MQVGKDIDCIKLGSGATFGITHTQPTRPRMFTPAASAKATSNRPVACTMKPVSTGAIRPAALPAAFCTPTQRPVACGPAMICGMANSPG